MACAFEQLVMNLWDGELDPSEHAEVCAHLATCRECERSIDQFAALSGLAASAKREPDHRRFRRASSWN